LLTGSIARRYARALFELAIEQKQEAALQEALSALAEAVRSNRDLKDLFENPAHTRDQRALVAESLCKGLRATPTFRSFLLLLVDRNRLQYLEGISRTFGAMVDTHAGRVRARVVSAVEMKEAAAKQLAKMLEAATGRTVVLERQVEPSLLGGVVAHVGGRVYDGSLKTQLEEMRQQLRA